MDKTRNLIKDLENLKTELNKELSLDYRELLDDTISTLKKVDGLKEKMQKLKDCASDPDYWFDMHNYKLVCKMLGLNQDGEFIN